MFALRPMPTVDDLERPLIERGAKPVHVRRLLRTDATLPLFIAAELPAGITGLVLAGGAGRRLGGLEDAIPRPGSDDAYASLEGQAKEPVVRDIPNDAKVIRRTFQRLLAGAYGPMIATDWLFVAHTLWIAVSLALLLAFYAAVIAPAERSR